MRKFLITILALGAIASPIAAQSTDDLDDANRISAAPIIAFALAAVTVAIFALDGDDEPASP